MTPNGNSTLQGRYLFLYPFIQNTILKTNSFQDASRSADLRTRSHGFVCVAVWKWAFDPFFGFSETISGDINEEKAKGKDERPAKDAEQRHENGF